MVIDILQTIGSLLGGIAAAAAFVSAFLIYNKGKGDAYLKNIKSALADLRLIVYDQYNLLSSSYVNSSVEEYFSNSYIQMLLNDLRGYIEKHLSEDEKSINKYWNNVIQNMPLQNVTFAYQNDFQKNYKENIKCLNKKEIFDFADMNLVVCLIELFKRKNEDFVKKMEDSFASEELSSTIICKVFTENKGFLNDAEIINRHLIQEYILKVQENTKTDLEYTKFLYELTDEILKHLFYLSDMDLKKFKSDTKSSKYNSEKQLSDMVTIVVKELPLTVFSRDTKDGYLLKIGGLKSN